MAEHDRTYDSESYASDFMPDKSIYQDDTRIFHRNGFTYEVPVSLQNPEYSSRIFTADLRLDSGDTAHLCLTAVNENAFRLQIYKGEVKFDSISPMLTQQAAGLTGFAFVDKGDVLEFKLSNKTLCINIDPFHLYIRNHGDRRLFELENSKIAGKYVSAPIGFRISPDGASPFMSWKITNEERFFGLGEKWNRVEKTSTRATVWAADTCGSNTTDMSYKSLPVLFSTEGWGVMIHSSFRSFWEIGNFSYTTGAFLTEDPRLDLFFFLGDTLKDLLYAYTGLTGRPSMPPKWALGTWMSRCQYENKDESDEAVNRLRELEIPADVIHLDPLWMKTHYYYKIGVDACDFVDNDEGFPDQPSIFREYADKGFATCLWLNPYLPEGSKVYEEAEKLGFLVRDTEGGLARLEHGQPVGIVDFTNISAKEWWKDKLKRKLKEGAAVFKPDYGDRVPENALFHNGRTGLEMHNMFLHYYCEAAFEAALEETGEGMVWRRAGYIGSQRYPGTWAGDTQVTWEAFRCCLRGGLSAGLTGEAFWGSDIGGFTGEKPSEELYIRWVQLGFLSGLTRFHGTTPREPWHYTDLAVNVVRDYANLRYALMPYILNAAGEAAVSGFPLMRHMVLEFPDEPNIETLDDQYMFGADILAAPVLAEGKTSRAVYLPKGDWFSLYEPHISFEGGRFIEAEAPMTRIPLFVREGSVIPKYAHIPQHLKGDPQKEFVLDIYPGRRDVNLAFNEGEPPISISVSWKRGKGSVTVSPCSSTFTVNCIGRTAEQADPDVDWVECEGNLSAEINAENGVAFELS